MFTSRLARRVSYHYFSTTFGLGLVFGTTFSAANNIYNANAQNNLKVTASTPLYAPICGIAMGLWTPFSVIGAICSIPFSYKNDYYHRLAMLMFAPCLPIRASMYDACDMKPNNSENMSYSEKRDYWWNNFT